jgi:hypothetical protein
MRATTLSRTATTEAERGARSKRPVSPTIWPLPRRPTSHGFTVEHLPDGQSPGDDDVGGIGVLTLMEEGLTSLEPDDGAKAERLADHFWVGAAGEFGEEEGQLIAVDPFPAFGGNGAVATSGCRDSQSRATGTVIVSTTEDSLAVTVAVARPPANRLTSPTISPRAESSP